MNRTLVAGRILYALPFALFGINHLVEGTTLMPILPPWLPGWVVWTYATALIFLGASICLVINRFVVQAGGILCALLIVIVLTIHVPSLNQPGLSRLALQNALQDLALAGGALLLAGGAAARA